MSKSIPPALLAALLCLSCNTYVTPGERGDLDTVARRTQVPAVASREYKVLLDAELFGGDPTPALAELWDQVQVWVEHDLNRDTDGDLLGLDVERTVRFLDVPGTCALDELGWVLRERSEGDDRQATVKFRSPDRFLAALRVPGDGDKNKFEEDISVGGVHKYSHSSTTALDDDDVLTTLDDVFDVVDDLDDTLELDDDLPLGLVGEVHERRYGPAVIDLGSLDAELTVTLWFVEADDTDPVIAEASFRYGDDDGEYSEKVVTRGMALLGFLEQLHAWRDPASLTKTAWIYAHSDGFCD